MRSSLLFSLCLAGCDHAFLQSLPSVAAANDGPSGTSGPGGGGPGGATGDTSAPVVHDVAFGPFDAHANEQLDILAGATDADDDPATLRIGELGAVSAGNVAASGQQVLWIPGAAFDGLLHDAKATVSFTFRAQDPADNLSALATATITLSGSDLPPTANAITGSTDTLDPLDIVVTASAASDKDGDAVTLQSVQMVPTGPNGALCADCSAGASGNTIHFAPGSATGAYELQYTVADPGGLTASAVATITVRQGVAPHIGSFTGPSGLLFSPQSATLTWSASATACDLSYAGATLASGATSPYVFTPTQGGMATLTCRQDGMPVSADCAITYAPAVFVAASGSDGNSGGSWDSALGTLQKAVSMAPTGGQVWAKSGTYACAAGGFGFASPNVSVYGGFAANLTGQQGSVGARGFTGSVIDFAACPNAGPMITANTTQGFGVDGIVLQNAMCTTGGANNGAFTCHQCAGTLANVTFQNNQTICAGSGCNAVGAAAYIEGSSGPLSFANCTFDGNRVLSGATGPNNGCVGSVSNTVAAGGAVYVNDSHGVTFQSSVFTNNQALGGSGANGSGFCSFFGGDAFGGAIAIDGNSQVSLAGGQLSSNVAQGGIGGRGASGGLDGGVGGNAYGGAIAVSGANGFALTLSAVTVNGNQAIGGVGGTGPIPPTGAFGGNGGNGEGGAIYANPTPICMSPTGSTIDLSGSTISNNSAVGGTGGGPPTAMGNPGTALGGGALLPTGACLATTGATGSGDNPGPAIQTY